MRRPEARNWTGPTIAAIGDVPDLLDEREADGATCADKARVDDMAFRL